MKIGHLVIATNKYMEFAQPLFDSAGKFFLPGHEVTLFLFTNVPAIEGVTRIEQEHFPWPGMTLHRYGIFWNKRDQLKDMDYLFYTDVDMLFVDTVGDDLVFARVVIADVFAGGRRYRDASVQLVAGA